MQALNLGKLNFIIRKCGSQEKLDGKRVKVWGYIDYDNTYTCAMNNWYFSLKSDKNDDTGESIHVNTPASYSYRKIYEQIHTMSKKNEKRPVLVTGVLHAYSAPMNFSSSFVVEIDVVSPNDVEFK